MSLIADLWKAGAEALNRSAEVVVGTAERVVLSKEFLEKRDKEFRSEAGMMFMFSMGGLLGLCISVQSVAAAIFAGSASALISPLFYCVFCYDIMVVSSKCFKECLNERNQIGAVNELAIQLRKKDLFFSVCEKHGLFLGVFAGMIKAKHPEAYTLIEV